MNNWFDNHSVSIWAHKRFIVNAELNTCENYSQNMNSSDNDNTWLVNKQLHDVLIKIYIIM